MSVAACVTDARLQRMAEDVEMVWRGFAALTGAPLADFRQLAETDAALAAKLSGNGILVCGGSLLQHRSALDQWWRATGEKLRTALAWDTDEALNALTSKRPDILNDPRWGSLAVESSGMAAMRNSIEIWRYMRSTGNLRMAPFRRWRDR